MSYQLPPELQKLRRSVLARRLDVEMFAEVGRSVPADITITRSWHSVPKLASMLATSRGKLYDAIKIEAALTARRGSGRYNPEHQVFGDDRLLLYFPEINIRLIDP